MFRADGDYRRGPLMGYKPVICEFRQPQIAQRWQTPYTRALRFQSVYSFHRSMWAASWSLLVVLAVLGGLSALGHSLLPSITVTGGVTIAALVGVAVFWNRKNKFDKTFVKYLFIDFYNAQQSTASENSGPGS